MTTDINSQKSIEEKYIYEQMVELAAISVENSYKLLESFEGRYKLRKELGFNNDSDREFHFQFFKCTPDEAYEKYGIPIATNEEQQGLMDDFAFTEKIEIGRDDVQRTKIGIFSISFFQTLFKARGYSIDTANHFTTSDSKNMQSWNLIREKAELSVINSQENNIQEFVETIDMPLCTELALDRMNAELQLRDEALPIDEKLKYRTVLAQAASIGFYNKIRDILKNQGRDATGVNPKTKIQICRYQKHDLSYLYGLPFPVTSEHDLQLYDLVGAVTMDEEGKTRETLMSFSGFIDQLIRNDLTIDFKSTEMVDEKHIDTYEIIAMIYKEGAYVPRARVKTNFNPNKRTSFY